MSTKDSTFGSFARSVSLPSLAPLTNEQEGRPLTCDLNGMLFVKPVGTGGGPIIVNNPYAGKSYLSTPPANFLASHIVSTYFGAQDLLSLVGFKSGTTALRYLQLFSGASLPPNGTAPVISIALPGANTSFSYTNPVFYDGSSAMFPGGTGIWGALSTTPEILTFSPIGAFWCQSLIGRI